MKRHISGLDAIRFICALTVAIGHYHIQMAQWLAPYIGDRLANLAETAYGLTTNGPAAVAIFFVLSGLVIHLPYQSGKPFNAAEYYARRYLRIVPPTIVFGIVLTLIDGAPESWNLTILWSVICEAVYYAVYPLIRNINFARAAIVTGIGALIAAFLNVDTLHAATNHYTAFGWMTFAIGAPIWLSGCAIAQHISTMPPVTTRQIWVWRGGIYLLSTIILIVAFHGIGFLGSNVITLTLFAWPASQWILRETRYFIDRPAPWLDRLGAASFSLYLTHTLVLTWLTNTGRLSFVTYYLITPIATLLLYLLVEKPSHRMARTVGRWALDRFGDKSPVRTADQR